MVHYELQRANRWPRLELGKVKLARLFLRENSVNGSTHSIAGLWSKGSTPFFRIMNFIIYGKQRVWEQLGRVKSEVKYFFQRLIMGYDDSELWNMDLSFYRWLYPRLKRFAEVSDTYPSQYKNIEEWKGEISRIVKLLEKIVIEEHFFEVDASIDKDKQEVLDWFHDNIDHLWW